MPKDKKGVKRNKGDDGPPKKLKRVDETETDMTKGTIRKEKPLNEHERLLKSVKNSLLFDENKPNFIANEEKDETKPEPLAILNESPEELDSMLKDPLPAASNQNSTATNEKIESMSKPIVQHQEDEIERQQRLREKITKLGVELKFAVLAQNLRKIKKLVKFFRFDALKITTGADEIKPTMPRELQYSLLSLAISSEDFQIVKFLIDTGFDVNYQDLEKCESPLLHQAVGTQDRLIIKELLNNGADVNAESRAGLESGDVGLGSTTALHLAISNEEDGYIIKMLLDNGANIGVIGSDKQSAMHHAVVEKNLAAVDILFAHYVLKIIDREIEEDSMLSNNESEKGFLNFFNLLLGIFEADNILAYTSIINFALYYAAKNGYNEMIGFLLDTYSSFNFELEQYIDSSFTVLHKATISGIHELTESILLHGADVNRTNLKGQTPLHCSAFHYEDEESKLAQLLLKYGANVNAKDKKQRTPLHTAVIWDNKFVIQVLIDHGADILIENNRGETAMDICVQKRLQREEYREISKSFITWIIIYYSDNADVCAKLSKTIEKCQDLVQFWENCLKEMQILKKYIIEDSNVTLFDVLRSSQNLAQLASYVRNESIEKTFVSSNLNLQFPIYRSLLSKAFEKGQCRKILEDKAKHEFSCLLDKSRKLPKLPYIELQK